MFICIYISLIFHISHEVFNKQAFKNFFSFFFFCTIFKGHFSFRYYKMLSVFPMLYNNICKPALHGNNSCTSPLSAHTHTMTSFFSISVSYPFLNQSFW